MASKLHYLGDDNLGPRGGKLYLFHCPGCEETHPFEVDCAERGWQWNGSLESPTFTPSLLVNMRRDDRRCHSFVTDGRIQFLPDCHHNLAGQTVELPNWEEVTDDV